ncbi:MAG: hypothetical protein ACI97K_002353 [Glaciecola sp.]|jgi:hypothetical protein
MTQHEYIFVTVSIIIGLAITRLLHVVGDLIRHHTKVKFHWSTALWALSIITFTLQIWWAGWGLHDFTAWQFQHFLILIFAAVCVYFAAEMALPDSDDGQFDMLAHSKGMGRISALAMLIYFLTGPYVNIAMFGHPAGLSLAIPLLGVLIMALVVGIPRWFKGLSILFAVYSVMILYITV